MSAFNLVLSAALMAGAPSGLAALRWEKRVLLVSAPAAHDPQLNEQRRIVRRWKAGAVDRDLVMIEIVSDKVTGANDSAVSLRRRYGMPATGFSVALIGKDGGVKLRERQPISAATLEATIDAMPMRRDEAR